MCRMLAFKSNKNIDASWIFEILRRMSRDGINSPHGDGFGFAISGEDRLSFSSTSAIWESKYPIVESSLGIVHARKASPGYVVNPNHVHPFYGLVKGVDYAFCHNGTVYDFASVQGTIDTQRYCELVFSNLQRYSPGEALETTTRFVASSFNYTSINALLTDYENIWAIRMNSEEADTAHGLFLYETDGLRIVASEPVEEFSNLPGSSVNMGNGELIKL